MELKKIIHYKERKKSQTSIMYESVQSKSCREFRRFSKERRAGRFCLGAGGGIVSEKPSSSSIVMGFSTDPAMGTCCWFSLMGTCVV